ncbi:hypothetical protein GALMADRAFT_216480 [Galerina marginata CBS 339.88]|uniref:Uncharacterized protein n=1 Tax=Galerina marginata (strain CBS 339.88) TaxID=685588 RepID=A0A067SKW7_GALM3|nr:hypothetical protein GALMADRAFT_216480 [Galerina marginata CBS 339.88]
MDPQNKNSKSALPGLNGGAIVNGKTVDNLANGTVTATESSSVTKFTEVRTLESTTQSLGLALTEIPWMRFKVVAESDIALLASDIRFKAFIQSVTETTVADLTEEITNEFTAALQQVVVNTNKSIATRLSTVAEKVIAQITALTTTGAGATGFQTLGFDANLGCGPGLGVGSTVAPPDLVKAEWIWTKEVVAANGNLPGMARPFLKVLSTTSLVNRLTIDIVCDNFYTLYVNGKLVGSGTDWTVAQRYTVLFEHTKEVVVAVYAVQESVGPQPVGLLSAGVVWDSQDKAPEGTRFTTNTSWKTFANDNFDRGFFQRDFNAGSWEDSASQGIYAKTQPWQGKVTLPTTESPSGPALKGIKSAPGQPRIPDAPDAPPAAVIISNEGNKLPTNKAQLKI